jgi:hypothetical protein
MKTHLLPLFLGLTACLNLHAQIGGQYTYSFLTLSPSARVSALGGSMIAVSDDDVNLAYANPSLLNADMHQQIGFSHGFLPAGIQYGYVAYGQHLSKMKATLHGGVQYVRYGDIDARNELNELEGSFKAAEYAIVARHWLSGLRPPHPGRQPQVYYVQSGFVYLQRDSPPTWPPLTTIPRDVPRFLLFLKIWAANSLPIVPATKNPLPFEVQLGLSRKLRYLPFRFSIIYQHLQRWNITYDDPNTKEEDPFFFGENPPSENETSVLFNNLFRHFIFNGEFLLGKKENLRLRIGYNHLMRKELSLENYRSLSGFTFGAGIKINRFRLDYGRTNYHLAGGLNHLSISTNLREFKPR